MAETAAQGSRENDALQVLKLTFSGMSVTKACQEVGISRSAFYAFQKDHPEFILSFQEKLIDTSKEQIMEILVNRVELLQKVIKDGLSEETSPMERLAIYQEMEKTLDRLAVFLRLGSTPNSEAALEVLGGPELVQAKSRFSAGQ
jgi:ACT domain-containing protein